MVNCSCLRPVSCLKSTWTYLVVWFHAVTWFFPHLYPIYPFPTLQPPLGMHYLLETETDSFHVLFFFLPYLGGLFSLIVLTWDWCKKKLSWVAQKHTSKIDLWSWNDKDTFCVSQFFSFLFWGWVGVIVTVAPIQSFPLPFPFPKLPPCFWLVDCFWTGYVNQSVSFGLSEIIAMSFTSSTICRIFIWGNILWLH